MSPSAAAHDKVGPEPKGDLTMTRTTCRVLGAFVLLVGLAGAARAQVTAADYDRAMGLRDRWMYLTDGVAEPATWVDGAMRFYYRKTVKGGFQFVMVDAQSLQRQPAFDHDKLAAALSAATGTSTPACGCRSTASASGTANARWRSRSTSRDGRAGCRNTRARREPVAAAGAAASRAASARLATPRSRPTIGPRRRPTGVGKRSSATITSS